MNKFLPPLAICCSQAKLQIFLYRNNTIHFKTQCPTHGSKGISSPFSKSLMDYEIIANGVTTSYSKEERRQYGLKQKGLLD